MVRQRTEPGPLILGRLPCVSRTSAKISVRQCNQHNRSDSPMVTGANRQVWYTMLPIIKATCMICWAKSFSFQCLDADHQIPVGHLGIMAASQRRCDLMLLPVILLPPSWPLPPRGPVHRTPAAAPPGTASPAAVHRGRTPAAGRAACLAVMRLGRRVVVDWSLLSAPYLTIADGNGRLAGAPTNPIPRSRHLIAGCIQSCHAAVLCTVIGISINCYSPPHASCLLDPQMAS